MQRNSGTQQNQNESFGSFDPIEDPDYSFCHPACPGVPWDRETHERHQPEQNTRGSKVEDSERLIHGTGCPRW
jgi:hypothetical protein